MAVLGCFLIQGSEKVKKLRAEVATEAQRYVASMVEVHSEVGQLRDNLREQHRIWLDFYSTVFHVGALCCSTAYLLLCMSTFLLLYHILQVSSVP